MVERENCEQRIDAPTCRYSEKCTRPPLDESPTDYCVCHAPENDYNAETRNQLWQEAHLEAQRDCDFEGWQFAADPSGRYFRDTPFKTAPRFSQSVFRCGVIFDRAFVEESGQSPEGTWMFCGARFLQEANFAGAVIRGGDFTGARFEHGANFLNASFGENGVSFNDTLFLGRTATFTQASFAGYATFFRAAFMLDVSCRETRFAPKDCLTSFYRSDFNGSADFEHAQFASVDFARVGFNGETSFRHAQFTENVNFTGATVGLGAKLHVDRPRGLLCRNWPFPSDDNAEIAYRLAKQAAHNSGDYVGASEYHYCERCAGNRRQRSRRTQDPWSRWQLTKAWFGYVFGRLIFGYGERPMRIFGISFAIVFIAASLAFFLEGIQENEPGTCVAAAPDSPYALASRPSTRPASAPETAISPGAWGPYNTPQTKPKASFWRCYYFSVVTFTTLGYGDYRPLPHFQLIASAEAVLGAAFMAMFVVSLTRKYMR